jgi:serine/threonine protein kinase
MNNLPLNIFGKKYQIERQLANNRSRQTFLAKDLENEILVVIKLLTFGNDFSWDDLKLFEREAETLKSLSHPAIPQYLEYFEIDTTAIKGFALVQSYIEAPSLGSQVESGRTFIEAEVKQIATKILFILDYLHSRQPIVIHRDLKPSNILISNRSGNSVGEIYLVDFGSVQNLATKKTGTITVVGTYGYMPPEQFGGKAKPASDLYSLGATLIYLVTGQHPAELPETDLKLEFEEFCNLSSGFTNWLQKMTNPSISSRLATAKKALEELENCDNYDSKSLATRKLATINKPIDSKVFLKSSSESIEIKIPSRGLFCLVNVTYFVKILAYGSGLLWVLFAAYGAIISNESFLYLGLLLLVYFIFIVIFYIKLSFFIKKIILCIFGLMKLKIDRNNISSIYQVFGITYNVVKPSLREKIHRLEKYQDIENYGSKYSARSLYLKIWTNEAIYKLSDDPDFPLSELEIQWISQELSNWLNLPVTEVNIKFLR